MKSKTIIFGLAVAILSIITLTQTNAQLLDQTAVTVIPDAKQDMIKVIYNYDSEETVEVKFTDADGIILKDKIKGNSFDGGFTKKYKVQRQRGDEFWVVVTNPELSVTYKVTTQNGKWVTQFEKATQYRVVASR